MNLKDRKTRIIVSAAGSGVVGIAAVGLLLGAGSSFIPSLSDKDMNMNKVVFVEDNDKIGKESEQESEDSLLGNDDNADQSDETDNGYEFDQSIADQNRQNNNTDASQNGVMGPNDGNALPGMDNFPGQGGTLNGNNPSQTQPGTNDGAGAGQGGNAQKPGTGKPRPSETVKDPASEKPVPDESYVFDSKPFNPGELVSVPKDKLTVVIAENWDVYTPVLYKGQTVEPFDIYCTLYTYVARETDTDIVLYLWDETSYDKFIRVSEVSFDGGKKYTDQFPVTLPKDMKDVEFLIKVEYRLTEDDEWETVEVPYDIKDNRLLVLSKALTDEDKNISIENIINKDNTDQFLEENSSVVLYRFQEGILREGPIESLFPGWTEIGESVPFVYTVGAARHILEPADLVPLDSAYTAAMEYYWMNQEGQVDDKGYNRCLLQTLTGVSTDVATMDTSEEVSVGKVDRLRVPDFIQTVDFEYETEVNHLYLPTSLIYMEKTGNLKVMESYEVAENNKIFKSYNGLLLSKDETQILGVPCAKGEITVPASINSVALTKDNSLRKITFEADTVEAMPQIDYSFLSDCTIVVDDVLLKEFMNANAEGLADTGVRVCGRSDGGQTWTIEKNAVIDGTGCLTGTVNRNTTDLVLPDKINSIAKGVLTAESGITTIYLPDNEELVLEKDCFKDSLVETIVCKSEKQKNTIAAQLEITGEKDILVAVVETTENGFTYYRGFKEGKNLLTLTAVPKELAAFNQETEGVLEGITTIAAEAFTGCENLTWVELPETVAAIGYRAFANCEKLQGILIENEATITIGDQAFDGCDSLRYVASNAQKAVMMNGYDPCITDSHGSSIQPTNYFYVPSGAQGYGTHLSDANRPVYENVFDENDRREVRITKYKVLQQNRNTFLLGWDEESQGYALLRSGVEVTGDLKLPTDITIIGDCAFADTIKEDLDGNLTDGFTINWEDLTELFCIRKNAFVDSGLTGNLHWVGEQGKYLENDAFMHAAGLQNFVAEGTIERLGESAFYECFRLENADLGYLGEKAYIACGLFDKCYQLETLTIHNTEVPSIALYGKGIHFRFNSYWNPDSDGFSTPEDEAAHLKLVVPEDAKDKYISEWKYLVGGYDRVSGSDPYLDMWDDIYFDIFFDYMDDNDLLYEEIVRQIKEKLTDNENYLRGLLGLPSVTEPTDFFTYYAGMDDPIALVGVPANLTVYDPEAGSIGLDSSWFEYIEEVKKGAFSGAANLKRVVMPSMLMTLYSGAFDNAGTESGEIEVEFSDYVPFLEPDENGIFTFGENCGRIRIIVPVGCKEDYIVYWSDYVDADLLEEMIQEKED